MYVAVVTDSCLLPGGSRKQACGKKHSIFFNSLRGLNVETHRQAINARRAALFKVVDEQGTLREVRHLRLACGGIGCAGGLHEGCYSSCGHNKRYNGSWMCVCVCVCRGGAGDIYLKCLGVEFEPPKQPSKGVSTVRNVSVGTGDTCNLPAVLNNRASEEKGGSGVGFPAHAWPGRCYFAFSLRKHE